MPVQRYVNKTLSLILYDGANGAEVVSALGYYDNEGTPVYPVLVSETGGILTVSHETAYAGPFTAHIPENSYVYLPIRPGSLDAIEYTTPAEIELQYVPLDDLLNP